MKSKYYPSTNIFKILTYALDPSPLFIILCTAIFVSYALMGVIMALIVIFGLSMFSLWFIKYAFSITKHTAEGYPESPIFSDSYIRPFEDYRPFKFGVILLVHIMIMSVLFVIYVPLFYIYGLLVLMFLPAIISELAMENKLFKTFDIEVLIDIVKASGKLYWVSFLFYVVIIVLLLLVYKSDLWLFFSICITLYLILVSFHVIGMTIYTRRESLGYITTYSPEKIQQENDNEKLKKHHRILDNVYSQHRQPSVLSYLERELINEPIETYEWFYNEIRSWDIKPKFKRLFIQLYCRKLCEADKSIDVLELIFKTMASDKEFSIDDNPTRLCILQAAIRKKDKTVIHSYSDLLLNDNDDLECRKKTFISLLQYHVEVDADDSKAQELLSMLTNEYPEMNDDKLIVQYRKVLNYS